MAKQLSAVRYAVWIYWKSDIAFVSSPDLRRSGSCSQDLLETGIAILSGHYSSLPLPWHTGRLNFFWILRFFLNTTLIKEVSRYLLCNYRIYLHINVFVHREQLIFCCLATRTSPKSLLYPHWHKQLRDTKHRLSKPFRRLSSLDKNGGTLMIFVWIS